jgi:predicted RNase H-like HicB family nuclease
MQLKVILEPGEDFGFVAEVPALPGCVSQGMTRQEALANVREAIELWLEVEHDKHAVASTAAEVELVQV